MIVRSHGKFLVMDSAGGTVLGTHPDEASAKRQLAAIEISKAKRAGK